MFIYPVQQEQVPLKGSLGDFLKFEHNEGDNDFAKNSKWNKFLKIL